MGCSTGLPEQCEHQLPGLVQHPDQRGCDKRDDPHHRCDPHGDLFGRAQGDLLGDQFADDQGQIGDRHNNRTNTQRLRHTRGKPGVDQRRRQTRPQRGTRECTCKDTDQRDTDLNTGQKPARILCQPDRGGRTLAAFIHEQAQPRRSGRDDGQL